MRQHAGGPHRSFKNLCQEAGIPPWMRARLPVLRVDGAAAWIGGIGLAADFACAPTVAGLEPEWTPAAPLVRAG
jgi:tRNA(Ile)-lysidine synthase